MNTLQKLNDPALASGGGSAPREHNRVCATGKEMGEQIARLCDQEVKKLIAEGEYEEDQRCASCAFRLGTVPNGCLQTQLDIMKSVLEHQPFMCHMVEYPGQHVCAGWFASVQAAKKHPKKNAYWKTAKGKAAIKRRRKKFNAYRKRWRAQKAKSGNDALCEGGRRQRRRADDLQKLHDILPEKPTPEQDEALWQVAVSMERH